MKLSTTMKNGVSSKWALLVITLFVSTATSFAQLTVTKSYTAPSSVTVDGCGTYCTNLPGVTFSASDFSAGVCQVADVDVSITWAKTDGTCDAPGVGNSFHNETNFRIDGPTGNEILVIPGAYSGNGTISSVTTVLDQAAANVIGGVDPISGTFRPNNGNLDNYIGTNPFGVWTLRAGDTGGGDPLCIVGYSVTITMSLAVDVDGDGYSNCNGDCNDNNIAINPGATEIECDGVDNDCNALTSDDATPPNAICQSTSVYLDGTGLATISGADVNFASNDNCSIASISVTPNMFSCLDAGSNSVTLTVMDVAGNSSTCLSTVTVIDSFAPVPSVSILPDFFDTCEVTSLTAPTAIDNCSSTLIVATSNAILPISTFGTTIVTWTYDDGAGNLSTQTQNVIVVDVNAPVPDLAVLTPVSGECQVTLTAPTATDACAGGIVGTTLTTFPITAQGTTTVTWIYDDGHGNISTQDQLVTLTDATAPVPNLAVLSNVTGVCEVTPIAPTATDACEGAITGTTSTVFPITTIGSTTITWIYNDGNGNSTSQNQTVIVSNITATTTATIDGVTLTSDITGDSYQWINCATNTPIVGATNANYTATANGSYAVIVTDGVCVDTSACASVTTVSVHALIVENLKLFPNPTRDGHFNLTFDGVIHSISVMDVTGREIPVDVNIQTGSVDASSLSNGQYFVRIDTNKGTKIAELIISM